MWFFQSAPVTVPAGNHDGSETGTDKERVGTEYDAENRWGNRLWQNIFRQKYNFQSQQQKTWKLLYTDSLTGVYNRRYYDDYIQNAEDIQTAVMIDVDNFKHINDNYGHDAGDIVLHSIAQTILSCIRKTDAVIRYGGDEFAVIFYQIPEDVFETKLERMRYLVEDLRVKEYPEIRMSISVGGAYGTKRAKELFKIADRMMYQSKLTKNQVNICFLDKKAESV